MMLAFLVGIGVSPKVIGFVENFGRTHVQTQSFCHAAGAPCVYGRFERTGDEVLAFLFAQSDAARRGLVGAHRAECVVTAPVEAVWNTERIVTMRGLSECLIAGKAGSLRIAPAADGYLVNVR